MKKILFFLILVTFCFKQDAQARLKGRERIDSLQRGLPALPDDTNKVNNLLMLCKTYLNFNPDSSILYGEKALKLAEHIGNEKTLCEVHYHLGTIYSILSEYEKSLRLLNAALDYSTRQDDKVAMASIYTNLSGVYTSQSNFPKAIELLFEARKLFEATKDTNGQGNSLLNIGNCYLELGDLTKSVEYYNKALRLYQLINTKAGIALATGNIGSVLGEQRKYDEAERYYKESLKLYREINDPSGIERNTSSLASLYITKGYFKTAIPFMEEAVSITQTFPEPESIGYNYSVYSEFYTALIDDTLHADSSAAVGIPAAKALKLAYLYADSAVKVFNELGALNELSSAVMQLSKTKKLNGDFKGALSDFEWHKQLADSIFNIEKDKKITRTAMQYEFDKKEAAVKAEHERKEIRQRLIRNAILSGLGGALIFLFIVYRQRNRIAQEKHRSETLLLNILPEEVAEELKAKGEAEAKQIDQVTVLFTDFKGFTQLSEKLSPRELVGYIHECFSAFDAIMHRYGIEKIKTIGDAYMAAGGLPTPNQTHPQDVVQAALDIQHYMQQHRSEKEKAGQPFFEIRIGVHTGPVVAGIVGVKKYSYDIWGDTVNTASRMESSCEVGKVNISGTTYALVKDQFDCQYRGKVMAKHKGEIDMYFVDSPKSA